jgi:hypothetical protein
MNPIGRTNALIVGILDGTMLILLVGALSAVFIYDLSASKIIPAEITHEIADLEGPPSEAPPLELAVVELPPEPPPAPPPPPLPLPEPVQPELPTDPIPRIEIRFSGQDSGKFGMFTKTGNPDDPRDDLQLMTYSENGRTNSTRVSVDGSTPNYAESEGTMVVTHHFNAADSQYQSAWKYRNVVFTQTVKLVPGYVSRRLDTAQVTLLAKNEDTQSHQVGARYLIDTYIGRNDGVPFIVAGKQSLIQDATTFQGPEAPHFIRALQNADLQTPGVIVDIGFRCPNAERPDEVILSHWPGHEAVWNYDRTTPLGQDSAAGMFYDPITLAAGESRTMGFTYGLGSISSTGSQNAKLSLTAGGPFIAGGSFWLVALVQSPGFESNVQIELPSGMSLGPGETLSKPVVAKGNISQISWLVNVGTETVGPQEISVKVLPEAIVERQSLLIERAPVKLSLVAPSRTTAGSSLWVSALIRNPQGGQTAELILPAGLSYELGQTTKQQVPHGKGREQINWLLKSSLKMTGNQRLQVQLGPDKMSAEATIGFDPPVSKLSIKTAKQASAGKAFWVSAVVLHPKPEQMVELILPDGFSFFRGHAATQAVSSDKPFHQLNWLVKSAARSTGDQKLQIRLAPDDRTEETVVTIMPGNIID